MRKSRCERLNLGYHKVQTSVIMLQSNANFIDAFATMVSDNDWNWWCTFTLPRELTLPGARRLADTVARDFCAPNVGPGCQETAILWAAEPFDCKEGFHIHAVLKNTLTFKGMRDALNKVPGRYGRCKFEPYNPKLGAGHYLGKYVGKILSDWDISRFDLLRKPPRVEIVEGVTSLDYDKEPLLDCIPGDVWNELEYSPPRKGLSSDVFTLTRECPASGETINVRFPYRLGRRYSRYLSTWGRDFAAARVLNEDYLNDMLT